MGLSIKMWVLLRTSRLGSAGSCTIIVLALICVTQLAYAQRRERSVDVWKPLHYDVAISLNDRLSEISSARTEIALQVLKPGLGKIDLDFGELPVDAVSVAGQPACFERAPDLLTVILPQAAKQDDSVNIVVTYHGRPKDGLIFAIDRDGKPSVTGDNWPNRVHQWIPCLDHPSAKATVSFTVSAPHREIVVANGRFVNVAGNAAVSHWRYEETKPIPPYCMIIAVSEGVKIDAAAPTVTPLSYYVPHKDASYAPKGFSSAAPALDFYSQTVAPYPYEKLALIVGATRFGGMENSSAIVFTSTLFDQQAGEFSAPLGRSNGVSSHFGIPTRIESVVAHEIAHQWFGDSVTESTWADLWLSEGFATYFAGLFIERYDGEDAFHEYMSNAAQRYFNFEKKASFPIHDTETTNLMGLLNPNNYEKGAWVLHMLRRRLGDDAFFRGLRDYFNEHREANATTDNLRYALEKASGKDLKDFFARWVYGSGHPRYQLEWNSRDDRAATLVTLTLKQIQPDAPFLDPVPIEFMVTGQKQRRTIYPKGKLASTQFRLDTKPTSVQIDPDETLLKETIARP